jgi:hypothetical protein
MAKGDKKMRNHNQALAPVGDMDASEVVGNRLYKIRHVAQHSDAWKGKRTQKAWADKHNFKEDSYSQWETGRRIEKEGNISIEVPVMFPIERAVALCDWSKDGVTLDYIYRGIERDLGRGWLPLIDAPDRPGFVRPTPPRRRE